MAENRLQAIVKGAPRSTYQGTRKDFAALLGGFVKATGKSFVVYDEAETVTTAKTNPKLIVKAYPMLDILHNAQANLSFPKSIGSNGIVDIMDEEEVSWFGIKEELRADYKLTMTRRIVNLCRVVNNGSGGGADWAISLPWKVQARQQEGTQQQDGQARQQEGTQQQDGPGQQEGTQQQDGQEGTQQQDGQGHDSQLDGCAQRVYSYGFDPEHRKAFRTEAGPKSAKHLPEFAKPIEMPADADDADPIIAEWHDGHTALIHDLTVGQWKAQAEARTNTPGSVASVWEGTHSITHHALKVKPIADRDPWGLMILQEQGRQVCQVLISIFDKDQALATTQAGEIMTGIAEMYAENQILTHQLYATRDSLLVKLGHKVRAKGKGKGKGIKAGTSSGSAEV